MVRYISTFFGGVFAMVVPIYLAHGREFIFLILGLVAGVGVGTLLTQLYLQFKVEREERLQAAARVFMVTHKTGRMPSGNPPVQTIPITKTPAVKTWMDDFAAPSKVTRGLTVVQKDAVSALVNFGMKKGQAVKLVEEEYVGQDFDGLMRKCLEVRHG